MGEGGPLTSSWLEEGRSALRVGFPEVCGPQCPDGLHPQWGCGQGLSPAATAALGSEVSEGVSNPDTVFHKGTREGSCAPERQSFQL